MKKFLLIAFLGIFSFTCMSAGGLPKQNQQSTGIVNVINENSPVLQLQTLNTYQRISTPTISRAVLNELITQELISPLPKKYTLTANKYAYQLGSVDITYDEYIFLIQQLQELSKMDLIIQTYGHSSKYSSFT